MGRPVSADDDRVPRRGWRADAACQGTDPSAWDTNGPHGHRPRAEPWQTALCAGCPVEVDCLAEAYVLGDREVIRGTLALTSGTRRNRRRVAERLAVLGVEVPVR